MIRPLSHVKILDLSRVLAGPWASQTLADLGADVIKVEHPEKGDDTRKWGPPFLKGEKDYSAYFLSTNRNKRSIAVNLKTKSGIEIVKKLAARSDVIIENFKPNLLKKYQLDFESIKQIQPNIIYCSITGYGQVGSCHQQAGYDFSIQGEAGYMSVTGYPDEECGHPTKTGVAIADLFTGLYAATSICAALANEKRSACHLDLSLFDCLTASLANQAMNYLIGGDSPRRLGNRHPNIVPYESFKAANGYFIIAAGNNEQFTRLAHLLGHKEWAEQNQFNTNENRVKHQKQLSEKINNITLTKSVEFWLERLKSVNIPCGAINTVEQVFRHSQIKERGLVDLFDVQGIGQIHLLSSPLKHAGAGETYYFPPKLGEHTTLILKKYLGIKDKKIRKWEDEGVIGTYNENADLADLIE